MYDIFASGESRVGVQGQPAMFRVAREDAVRQICEKLRHKLTEFIELESYDWLLVEPEGYASSFVSDFIAFLQSTFQSFTNLPVNNFSDCQVLYNIMMMNILLQPEAAQVACKSACEHIAKSMQSILLSEEVKQISMGALHQINLDLLQCERKHLLTELVLFYLNICVYLFASIL